MARTHSLLLALALSPVAKGLGVTEPYPKECRCAAKTEVRCNSALACDLFQLPEGHVAIYCVSSHSLGIWVLGPSLVSSRAASGSSSQFGPRVIVASVNAQMRAASGIPRPGSIAASCVSRSESHPTCPDRGPVLTVLAPVPGFQAVPVPTKWQNRAPRLPLIRIPTRKKQTDCMHIIFFGMPLYRY